MNQLGKYVVFIFATAFLYKWYVTDVWTIVQRQIFLVYSPSDSLTRLVYLHSINIIGIALFSLALSIVAGYIFRAKAWVAAFYAIVLSVIYYLYPYGLPSKLVHMQYPLVKIVSLLLFSIIFSVIIGLRCEKSYNNALKVDAQKACAS
jgi:hypothetical protein